MIGAIVLGFLLLPYKILSWFVTRWQMETTFQEVRRQL
jgi:hypothetical protein